MIQSDQDRQFIDHVLEYAKVEEPRRAATADGFRGCTQDVEYFDVPLTAEMATEYGLGEGSRLILVDTPGFRWFYPDQWLRTLRRIAVGLSHS